MSVCRKLFIGVDGGGTKTRAVCIEQASDAFDYQIIGQVTGRGTNQNSVGKQKAKENLRSVIQSLLRTAEAQPTEVEGICLGMSGVDRPDDVQLTKDWVSDLIPEASIQVRNDAVIALAAGTNGILCGAVVICGTGCIALACHNNKEIRASGWGPLLGDIGSGFWIGQQALTAIANAHDGTGPVTSLTDKILTKLSLEDPTQIIGWAYKDYSWERFAALYPAVHEAAQEGDAVAVDILNRAANGLVACAAAVIRRAAFEDNFAMVLTGGVLLHEDSLVASKFCEKIMHLAPMSRITRAQLSPETAAAVLAMKSR